MLVRGTDNQLWQRSYAGTWSEWILLGGTLTSEPAAVSWGPGHISVFARGADNTLQQKFYVKTWHEWESLGGTLVGAPSAASQGVNTLDVFARGHGGVLLRKSWNGTRWGDWAQLPSLVPVTLQLELRDLRHFKADIGKTIHFVGELHNTGTGPIGFPTAKVTLFDAADTAVDSGTCASPTRQLDPGQTVPCVFSIVKATTFATSKIDSDPLQSFYKGELAALTVTDTKLTPKQGFNPHTVTGKITNTSNFTAKSVWALVSLYGADGKIVGADQAQVNDLAPGTSGSFTAKIYNVAAEPSSSRVVTIGYSE